jgi:GDP-mannose 6-dehydrogenase
LKISVFGLGYVGAVCTACLAQLGHRVIGVDTDRKKVGFIKCGKSPVIEASLEDIISEQCCLGNIKATNEAKHAVSDSEVSLICVGTPSTENGHLNLEAIWAVAWEIGRAIREKKEFHVVAIRSTVSPGTNDKVVDIIEEASGKKHGERFSVVSNPEFLREGSAIKDFYSAPFTLVGTRPNDRGGNILAEVYKGVNAPIIFTDVKVAELIKYVNNSFHALKITFANEIGNICKRIGIDSRKVMNIFCMDHKLNLSSYYLKPGFAYGGSCLPKDLRGLTTIAHDLYSDCPVLNAIEKSNETQKRLVLQKIISYEKRRIGFLGLSFKAGTDDLRNSPIIDIIEQLLGKGFEVKIYDKKVHLSKLIGANKQYILQKIPLISKYIEKNAEKIIRHSELIVIVNNDPDFSEILHRIPSDTLIYDLVNIDRKEGDELHNYEGISWQ